MKHFSIENQAIKTIKSYFGSNAFYTMIFQGEDKPVRVEKDGMLVVIMPAKE